MEPGVNYASTSEEVETNRIDDKIVSLQDKMDEELADENEKNGG